MVDAMREPLRRFCVGYLGDADAAEDAVQDVLAKIVEGEDQPDNLRVWTFAVARNHCLNMLRSRGRRRDRDRLPSGTIADGQGRTRAGFLTGMVRQEEQQQLERAFDALPEGEREVLRLRYADGLSRREIAEVVDIPESLVKTRLFEGMKRLRADLAP